MKSRLQQKGGEGGGIVLCLFMLIMAPQLRRFKPVFSRDASIAYGASSCQCLRFAWHPQHAMSLCALLSQAVLNGLIGLM